MKTENMKTAGVWNSRISKFSVYALARAATFQRVKSSVVILGDDNKFWVVCFADARKLFKAGYQQA